MLLWSNMMSLKYSEISTYGGGGQTGKGMKTFIKL